MNDPLKMAIEELTLEVRKHGDSRLAALAIRVNSLMKSTIDAMELCVNQLYHDGVPMDAAHPKRVAVSRAEEALAALSKQEQEPYAYEYGKPNGDGTYSVVIERGRLVKVSDRKYEYLPPINAVPEHPVKPLYSATVQQEAKPDLILMSEQVEQAAERSGFKCTRSCCDVPHKFCSTDVWQGELRAFGISLLRIITGKEFK